MDLMLGQTCTEMYKFISGGVAHTFQFNFDNDKIVFVNLSDWTATAGGKPISVWYKDATVAAHASQQQVIDSSAGASFNFIDQATNGFTVANLLGGQASAHALITGITAADPCVITHSAYTFQDNQIVRLTDLGQVTDTLDRGMGPLNNQRFKIVVLSPTTFFIKDVITGEPIDSSLFPAYVSGGRICLETHVISLNNPQVSPYSSINPYHPNPFRYDPITYQLVAGTAVMGTLGDVFRIECYKFGQVTDLGQI